MHIDQEIKLDFKDVLIRPKRSTLTSRSEVDISRDFIFRHRLPRWPGQPARPSTKPLTRRGSECAGRTCHAMAKRYIPALPTIARCKGRETPAWCQFWRGGFPIRHLR